MKTALRLAVCLVIAMAASRAFAGSPSGNGCGDGEANVPFAAAQELAIAADDIGGGSGEPGLHVAAYAFAESSMSNGVGDGEANVPFAASQVLAIGDDIGGGSGEPGRTGAGAMDAAAQAEADREFVLRVWTAP